MIEFPNRCPEDTQTHQLIYIYAHYFPDNLIFLKGTTHIFYVLSFLFYMYIYIFFILPIVLLEVLLGPRF